MEPRRRKEHSRAARGHRASRGPGTQQNLPHGNFVCVMGGRPIDPTQAARGCIIRQKSRFWGRAAGMGVRGRANGTGTLPAAGATLALKMSEAKLDGEVRKEGVSGGRIEQSRARAFRVHRRPFTASAGRVRWSARKMGGDGCRFGKPQPAGFGAHKRKVGSALRGNCALFAHVGVPISSSMTVTNRVALWIASCASSAVMRVAGSVL